MMEFEITYADGEVETGLCWEDVEELSFVLRQAYSRREEITVRLFEHDPTPEIMPIGEMF